LDSLRFQFPNWTLRLPGYAYAGDDPDGFAHYHEIRRMIEDYAASIRAPVREHSEVVGLAEDGDQGFLVSLSGGSLSARRVVVATGPGAGDGTRGFRGDDADRPHALPQPSGAAGGRGTRRRQRGIGLSDR